MEQMIKVSKKNQSRLSVHAYLPGGIKRSTNGNGTNSSASAIDLILQQCGLNRLP
jgi:hypothetical protein